MTRRPPRRVVLLFALLLSLPAARGEEVERVPGTATFSNGTTLTGKIRTTGGKPLSLFDTSAERRRKFPLAEIHRITTRVVFEEEYAVWRWVEDGSREKVFTGETFPKREYETEITTKSGRVYRGHAVAVLYLYKKGGDKPVRLILKKKEQGKIGKTLADLNYVETILFNGPTPKARLATAGIRLVPSPAGSVLDAVALRRDQPEAVRAVGLTFADLTPGTWDLCVVTAEAIHLHLAGERMRGEALEAIRARVAEIADFFEDREVLLAMRDGALVRALVVKNRKGPTSAGKGLRFRRWEVWSMHKGGERWKVDHRAYVFREFGQELPLPRGFVLTPGLGGVKISEEVVTVNFAVSSEDGR